MSTDPFLSLPFLPTSLPLSNLPSSLWWLFLTYQPPPASHPRALPSATRQPPPAICRLPASTYCSHLPPASHHLPSAACQPPPTAAICHLSALPDRYPKYLYTRSFKSRFPMLKGYETLKNTGRKFIFMIAESESSKMKMPYLILII